MFGLLQCRAQRIQFRCQQHPGTSQRRRFGHGFGGGFGAVGSAESVVHIDVAQGGISFAQVRIVFLFAHVQAHIRQHDHGAGRQVGLAVAPVFQYRHRLPQQSAQALGHRRHAVGRFGSAFSGTAKMGHHNHGGAVVDAVADGGQRGADAGVIADNAVLQRHIHIGTNQNGFGA